MISSDKSFEYVDSIEVNIPDSFVVRANKIDKGNGEAKLYLGSNNKENRDFFGNVGFKINIVIYKKEVLKFFENIETFYNRPIFSFRHSTNDEIKKLYKERYIKLKTLPNEIFIQLEEKTNLKNKARVYVIPANEKSNEYFNLFLRELPLPYITYFFLRKYTSNKAVVYHLKLHNNDPISATYGNPNILPNKYFPLIDENLAEFELEKSFSKDGLDKNSIQKILKTTSKEVIAKQRIGQSIFRKKLLNELKLCPITNISFESLLIASHIKPWRSASNNERLDINNGLIFSPLVDKLFDKGYITFIKNQMFLSRYMPKNNIIALKNQNIKNKAFYNLFPYKNREYYLDYHSNEIFEN